jgi:hypothetical protein
MKQIGFYIMIVGLVIAIPPFIFKARPSWKWGVKNFWKVGVAGFVLLFVGGLFQLL